MEAYDKTDDYVNYDTINNKPCFLQIRFELDEVIEMNNHRINTAMKTVHPASRLITSRLKDSKAVNSIIVRNLFDGKHMIDVS